MRARRDEKTGGLEVLAHAWLTLVAGLVILAAGGFVAYLAVEDTGVVVVVALIGMTAWSAVYLEIQESRRQ